ncbi:D-tyrosyl-tRNA(Tyr) deacylase [Caloranaerobacter azorensis H53214]|uniref:D-aminoacyl-tRNA deacylase n=2 Tax=Caloranaerobacter azorensis TaxID=116090 RepID=A0A1M5TQF9_9FIRM|nr:D-aminoacyl-tRNA deacylase [Caloranaerobacter azorensis]KGG81509.1 D-tyrosyl-tRNA(Tyr) deacylase [Caloranaerobacter azorensis H53214]SHH52939.1 D-tyrosyl-tRNA(Tyr) deacylase [Caloranaerobacter azorensis DSM 13643]
MRAVVQRVTKASVSIEGVVVGSINKGLLVLLGVGQDDNEKDLDYLCDKIANLRIFEDENGKMNKSLVDINGELLVVSQFTLYGDVRKGRRPNFMNAAEPKKAESMYLEFVNRTREKGVKVETGRFGEHMHVELINDGPVTILLDSKKIF